MPQRRGTRLSVEFLNWASNQAIGRYEDGGFFSDLWKGFPIYGVCPEEDMPYRDKFDPEAAPAADGHGQRASGCTSAGLSWHWIKPWDVKTGLTDAQFVAIKRTLSRQWPVCAGFRWPKAERWNDGVLEMAPPEGVLDGHSVLLVGFRDDRGAARRRRLPLPQFHQGRPRRADDLRVRPRLHERRRVDRRGAAGR